MRILVTGGAGFIGSGIASAYIGLGHEVTIVDNLVRGNPERVPSQARFVKADIADPELEGVFSDQQFDVVSHHAAHVSVRESLDDPELDARNNVWGTLNLLKFAAKYGVRKVIYAGTVGAYGEPLALPVTEDHPIQPLSPYGISKAAAEHYVRFYGMAKGLQAITLRYANVYGPHANTEGEAGVVTVFASLMVRGRRPSIFGSGEQTRDFVYLDDVVRANVASLDYPYSDCFNVSTNSEITVNELFATMARLTGFAAEPVYEPGKVGEIVRIYLDNGKAKRLLGWEPSISLVEGLERVVTHMSEMAGPERGR